MNKQYLDGLRSRSCYPTFRGFVAVITVLTYVLAALVILVGFLTGQMPAILGCIVAGVLLIVLAKAAQEVSLMIADMADATIDTASRPTAVRATTARSEPRFSASVPADAAPAAATPIAPTGSPARGSGAVPEEVKGSCPNCGTVMLLDSKRCAKCNASFAPGSAYRLRPVG